jgi:peptide/nickel transport system substrate-binding protein
MRPHIQITIAALAAAIVLAGCGGSSPSSSTSTSSGPAAPAAASITEHPFANFRIAYDNGIDFLDPALSYTTEGWSIMWNVYLPLLGYPHVNGTAGGTLVPYLATALPKITDGGLTYTLFMRKGLKYSNGKPVLASDFKATVERDYKMDSPGVFYFADIVGAPQYAKTRKGNIAGIQTSDGTGQITIHLLKPEGDFSNILALNFLGVVPASTPDKDQSTTPIPSTGPYIIQSYQPNKQVIMARNPYWKDNKAAGMTYVPDGNPDTITIQVIDDPNVALTRTLDGQDDYDFQQPPTDRLGELQKDYPHNFKVYMFANVFFYFMNVRRYPFNLLKVRQAVNYAINRQALVRIYGGLAVPTESVVPDSYPNPSGVNSMYPYDPAKARQLIDEAGAKGAKVTVWTEDNAARRAGPAGVYLQSVLQSIGLNTKLKIVSSAIYNTAASSQASKVQIGWSDDYNDFVSPAAWYSGLLAGAAITPVNNNNQADFNDPAINTEIARLSELAPPYTAAENAEWSALEKSVMEQAPWAPYLDIEDIDTFNSDMDLSCYVNQENYGFDFATICKK